MPARRIPLPKPLTKAELAAIERQEGHWRNIVGANIRRIRHAAGWTQLQLAVRADVNSNHLGQVERGIRAPTLNFISRLALALNVSPVAFFVED